MKRFLLMTTILVCVFSMAQAQRDSGQRPSSTGGGTGQGQFDPAARIERQVQELKDSISLTNDQVVKVKAIITKNNEESAAAFQKMRDSGEQPDREAMRTQMEQTRTKLTNAIKAVLTDAQKAKYDKYLKN